MDDLEEVWDLFRIDPINARINEFWKNSKKRFDGIESEREEEINKYTSSLKDSKYIGEDNQIYPRYEIIKTKIIQIE